MKLKFRVLYLAETEKIREWKADKNELKFHFDVMFKGNVEDINSIKMAWETYKRLNFYNPYVVIVSGYKYLAYWATMLWCMRHNKKLIVIIESHFEDKPRSFLKEKFKKFFLSKCNAALVPGTKHKNYAISLGIKKDNVFIINGVGAINQEFSKENIAKFRLNKFETHKQLGIPPKNFLFVGRFSEEKNLLFLLKAFGKLKDEGVNEWGLILVGNGPQRKDIENLIAQNEIRDVLLVDFKQGIELVLYFAISEVFILPSISETWGLVVNEAMVTGLPVLISKKCGCYPDLVKDGENGFSFDPLNKDELFCLMKEIVVGRVDLKKFGENSLEIIKGYELERTATKVAEAVENVLRRR
jgi:Glycosyltransferase